MENRKILSQRVHFLAALFALAPLFLLAQNAPAAAEKDAGKLIAVLKSDAPLYDKAKACQRLAVIGTKDAVPALAGLLEDEKLAHYARFGLEPIPDPSVDDALREAMGKLKGKFLVGVINSIGVRRDAKAREGLTTILKGSILKGANADAALASAAALGRIGTSETAKVLQQALPGASGSLRPAIAEACLACAERLASQGQRDQAVSLYDDVRKADLPGNIQAAATRGAIIARQAAGVPLLVEKLQGSDYASFALALGVAREAPGKELTQAMLAQLGSLQPERKALVIEALADRGDAAALPAVLEAAKSGPPEVRVAAIRALRKIGNASAVPVLMEAAAGSGENGDVVAQAAQETLEGLGGKEVDEAIVALVNRDESRLQPALIELVGRRRITQAVPALRKAADQGDEPTRLAAIKALGMTVGTEDLPVLIARLVNPKEPQETAAVQEALRTATKRLSDKDGSAGKLIESMSGVPVEAKCRLLEVFSSVGGPKALKAVSLSAADTNDRIKSSATRVLGEWMSEDAAPELLRIAKASDKSNDRMSAYRSFSRVVSRLRFPKEQRLALCQQAMELAKSDEERKVVLETLAAIPAVETLTMLAPYLKSATLKEDASSAAVTIGERLIQHQPDAVRASMKQVVEATESKDLAERAQKLLKAAGAKP